MVVEVDIYFLFDLRLNCAACSREPPSLEIELESFCSDYWSDVTLETNSHSEPWEFLPDLNLSVDFLNGN